MLFRSVQTNDEEEFDRVKAKARSPRGRLATGTDSTSHTTAPTVRALAAAALTTPDMLGSEAIDAGAPAGNFQNLRRESILSSSSINDSSDGRVLSSSSTSFSGRLFPLPVDVDDLLHWLDMAWTTQATRVQKQQFPEKKKRDKPLVLAAEDEPFVRTLLESQLKRAGCDAVLAPDGKQAVALFKEHLPDVVLLDAQMPFLAGPEVARQIRLIDSSVPIIGITAAGDLDTTKACLHAGMNSVIQRSEEHTSELQSLE